LITIPSHFGGSFSDGGVLNNITLRFGEVQAVYFPEDPQNLSKRVVEYSVLVQHRSGSTVVSRMYHNCFAADLFGGISDTLTYTYRADPSASTMTAKKRGPVGNGSRVLVLCINGEEHSAVILAGIQHPSTPKAVKPDSGKPEDFHNLHFRFQGIDVAIDHEGQLTLEYQGAMKADGTMADGVDAKSVGTTIKITKDGNFKVADKDDKSLFLLDHVNGKVQFTAENEFDITSKNIKFGSTSADEPQVLGNALQAWIGTLIDQICQIIVITSTGNSSPPTNTPQLQALKATFADTLSEFIFAQRTP
jgi:hypothetical protein